MMSPSKQSGFTAIELLITLFVAAAFLVAGYQLFNVVIKDGGQARSESRAGNVAYDYMRRYSSLATNPCTAQPILNNSPIVVDSLSNTKITVTISCPDYYTVSNLSRIDVTLTFNTPLQTVKYSTYINGTGPQASDITEGLIGWWKLNGDTTSSVGSFSQTSVGITPTTGQNGLSNNAYNFSGTGSYLSLGNNTVFNSTNITISAWIRPTAISSGNQEIVSKELNYKYRLGSSANVYGFVGINGTTWTVQPAYSASSIAAGSWSHVVMSVSASDSMLRIFANGLMIGVQGVAPIATFNTNPVVIGAWNTSGGNPFNGSIDDVRIYNRVLSDAEITALYTGGAK